MLKLTYNPTRRILTPAIMADIMDRAYENFPEGRDLMKLAAEYIFNTPYDHVSAAQRKAAKSEAYGLLYSTADYDFPPRKLTPNEVSNRWQLTRIRPQPRTIEVQELLKDAPWPGASIRVRMAPVRNWPVQAEAAQLLGLDLAKGKDKTTVAFYPRGAEAAEAYERLNKDSLAMAASMSALSDKFHEQARQFSVVAESASKEILAWLKEAPTTGRVHLVVPQMRNSARVNQQTMEENPMTPFAELDFSKMEDRISEVLVLDSLEGYGKLAQTLNLAKSRLGGVHHLLHPKNYRDLMDFYDPPSCVIGDEDFDSFPAIKPKKKFAKALQDQRKAKRKNVNNVNPLLAGLIGKLK